MLCNVLLHSAVSDETHCTRIMHMIRGHAIHNASRQIGKQFFVRGSSVTGPVTGEYLEVGPTMRPVKIV